MSDERTGHFGEDEEALAESSPKVAREMRRNNYIYKSEIVMPPSNTTPIPLGERVSFSTHRAPGCSTKHRYAQEVYNINLTFRDCDAAQQNTPIRLSERVSYLSDRLLSESRRAEEAHNIHLLRDCDAAQRYQPHPAGRARLFPFNIFQVPRRRVAIGVLQTRGRQDVEGFMSARRFSQP